MRIKRKIRSKKILIGFISAFFAFLFSVFIYGLVTKQPATFKYFPTEPPIVFQANAQNKGTRCMPVYYGMGDGDGIKDPFCSDLENQLGEAAATGNIEKMKTLLRNGANANAHTGISLLQTAAEEGQTEAVRLLLDNGTDIHYRHPISGTPLLSAVA
ncbi:MAG: ankyrin repeat domain-containing protein, partial [Actinomycetota bacterium]